jgi:hypothetical protein
MVPINYVAVLIAAVAQYVIGFMWHGPLFGKYWMEITGIHPTDAEKKNMWRSMVLGFISSLVTAFVMAHMVVFVTAYTNTQGWFAGAEAGFWTWLGFVGPVTLNLVLWERFSMKRWYFANAYHLISLMTMGAILASI